MNVSRQFTRKYLLSNFLFFLTFSLCNLAISILLPLRDHSIYAVDPLPIDEIMKCIVVDSTGAPQADTEKLAHLLGDHTAFVMLLDSHGTVVWSENMPTTLPRHYDRGQLLSDSQAVFQRFPTVTRPMGEHLLAICYIPHEHCFFHSPPRSPNASSDSLFSFLHQSVYFFLLLNFIFSVVILLYSNHRIRSLFLPILQGIEHLVTKNHIPLQEKGELSDLRAILNRTSVYIDQKDSARSEWIKGISHDVRTPLSCIMGYSNELEEDISLPLDAREKARAIRIQSEKLSRLISNLNLVSRLEYSMQPIDLREVDPAELARHIIIEFLESSTGSAYTFDLDLRRPIPDSIRADVDLLRRLLENLIQNSVNHNPDGCSVVVTLELQNKMLVFHVTDDGVGIPPERLRLFNGNIFTQDAAHQGQAYGLGIQLVYKIAEVHHGSVLFTPVEPHGLSVSVRIPVK